MGTLLHPTRVSVSRPERAGRPAARRLRTVSGWLLAVLVFTVLLVPVLQHLALADGAVPYDAGARPAALG